MSNKDRVENISEQIDCFNGTEQNLKKDDRISLWEHYWLEYINAFDSLIDSLPKSVVTIYIGRQAIEIGFKYLLLKKTGQIKKEHNLGNLSHLLFTEYDIKEDYMDYVDTFCDNFCKYIEGDNSEYFRFPEYKKGKEKVENYRTHKLISTSEDEWIVTENHHEPIISKD